MSRQCIFLLHIIFVSSTWCMDVPSCLRLTDVDIWRMRIAGAHSSENLDSSMHAYLPRLQENNTKDIMQKLCNAIYAGNNIGVKEIIDRSPHFLNTYHQHDNNCKIFNAEYKRLYSSYQNDKIVPLHIAVTAHNYDCTKLLLHEYKADPNVKTLNISDKNAAPLHLSQNSTITHLLIVFDATVDQKDHCDRTPLYMSLFNPYVYSDLNVAEVLIKYGQANINGKTYNGQTLLHEAIRHNRNMISIVRFLLRYGADKELKDNLDETPLKLALQLHSGYEELINLLR